MKLASLSRISPWTVLARTIGIAGILLASSATLGQPVNAVSPLEGLVVNGEAGPPPDLLETVVVDQDPGDISAAPSGVPGGSPPTFYAAPQKDALEHCATKTDCEACVERDEGFPPCAWVPDLFYGSQPCTQMSCDVIADPNCFSMESSSGTTPEEICPSKASDDGSASTDEIDSAAAVVGNRCRSVLALMVLSLVLA